VRRLQRRGRGGQGPGPAGVREEEKEGVGRDGRDPSWADDGRTREGGGKIRTWLARPYGGIASSGGFDGRAERGR
jgi:hypothetical protein